MHLFGRFILKIAANAAILYVANEYAQGIELFGGYYALALVAAVLALLNIFLRPILRFITTPLRWITFGLFNIVISIAILWLADQLLASFAITDAATLLWLSVAMGFVNALI